MLNLTREECQAIVHLIDAADPKYRGTRLEEARFKLNRHLESYEDYKTDET